YRYVSLPFDFLYFVTGCNSTSIFPRVALEYGQTWCAVTTNSSADSGLTPLISTWSSALILKPLSTSSLHKLTFAVVSDSIGTFCFLATKFSATSNQAAYALANSCSGLEPTLSLSVSGLTKSKSINPSLDFT